jgi:hypothetical protein
VAGLAGVSRGAEPRLTAEDHTESDADFTRHEQQVLDAGGHAAAMLAEGPEIGLVRHRDRSIDGQP